MMRLSRPIPWEPYQCINTVSIMATAKCKAKSLCLREDEDWRMKIPKNQRDKEINQCFPQRAAESCEQSCDQMKRRMANINDQKT